MTKCDPIKKTSDSRERERERERTEKIKSVILYSQTDTHRVSKCHATRKWKSERDTEIEKKKKA